MEDKTTGELHGAEAVCKAADSGSIPALVSTWQRVGAKSPHFSDVGKALRAFRGAHGTRSLTMAEVSLALDWYEFKLVAAEEAVRAFSRENSRLKRQLGALNG